MTSRVVGISRDGTRRLDAQGVAEDAAFRVASVTKSLTAVAVLRALREAGIPVDHPARDLLPDLAADWAADPRLTVDELLGQVSGLRPDVDAAAIAPLGDGDASLREGARLVVRAGQDAPPGHRWQYYNGNYFLAGALLEAITGATYEAALSRLVLEPWGLVRTGFATPPDPAVGLDAGVPVVDADYPRGRRPSGGLWSTVPDLLTFCERLLADRALLDEVRRPRTGAGETAYGLGWALGPSGQIYLNGRLPGYRAAMVLIPEHAWAGVALAADTDALPGLARVLSDAQRRLTGDDLAEALIGFAR